MVLFIAGVAWARITYFAHATAYVELSRIDVMEDDDDGQGWHLYASSDHWGEITDKTLVDNVPPNNPAITAKFFFGLAWFRDDGHINHKDGEGNKVKEYAYGRDVDYSAVRDRSADDNGTNGEMSGQTLLAHGSNHDWTRFTRSTSVLSVDDPENYWVGAYTTVGFNEGSGNDTRNLDYQMKAAVYQWSPSEAGTYTNGLCSLVEKTIGE